MQSRGEGDPASCGGGRWLVDGLRQQHVCTNRLLVWNTREVFAAILTVGQWTWPDKIHQYVRNERYGQEYNTWDYNLRMKTTLVMRTTLSGRKTMDQDNTIDN